MSWIGKLSPVIIFVIVLLAVVLFVASLVHLLLLHLSKRRGPANSHNYPLPASAASGGGFQRQLQQLFNLHDSGMDQSQIDALPVFLYRDIIITGLREPFDCAVCLCEFSGQDRLRLLPSCSHAFHIGCIDTWLLSNSTCPLCRGVILSSGYSFQDPFFYFEAASKEDVEGGGLPCAASSSSSGSAVISEKRVFSVRLGKFRSCTNNNNNNNNNNDNDQESEVGGESSNLDGRRCFSMGSCQYVVDDLELQVALCPSGRRGGQNGNFTVGGGGGEVEGKKINSRIKGESFSVSKIWLWSKKGKLPSLP